MWVVVVVVGWWGVVVCLYVPGPYIRLSAQVSATHPPWGQPIQPTNHPPTYPPTPPFPQRTLKREPEKTYSTTARTSDSRWRWGR
jgi:hypothetical protein